MQYEYDRLVDWWWWIWCLFHRLHCRTTLNGYSIFLIPRKECTVLSLRDNHGKKLRKRCCWLFFTANSATGIHLLKDYVVLFFQWRTEIVSKNGVLQFCASVPNADCQPSAPSAHDCHDCWIFYRYFERRTQAAPERQSVPSFVPDCTLFVLVQHFES